MPSPDSTLQPNPRALLVAVPLRDRDEADVQASLAEMVRLLAGLGVDVVHTAIQRRDDDLAILGPGKLRELARLTGGPGVEHRGPSSQQPDDLDDREGDEPIADLVVVDAELSPAQQRRLAAALGVDVMDRTGTILRVFERRARTREAKLEVELARAQYDVARSREIAVLDDREGGGGRGERGHSNAELARQRHHRRMATLRRELEVAQSLRDRKRARRGHVPTVALVGYTNAGKSSLMRALTGSEVYVDDKLFATLDTTVRAIEGTVPRVLVSDTVGFLEHLPHELIASFRSTLDEAAEAWLLLFVLDASDPRLEAHLQVTTDTLGELGVTVPQRIVLNKMDRVDSERRALLQERFPDALMISAFEPADVDRLRNEIVAALQAEMVQADLRIPYTRGEMIGEVHQQAHVLREAYEEDGVAMTVLGPPAIVARLAQALA